MYLRGLHEVTPPPIDWGAIFWPFAFGAFLFMRGK